MEGTIVKLLGGLYTVYAEEQYIECKARGRFRKDGDAPMVGDKVQITCTIGETPTIDMILERKNHFIRPAIANIDTLAVVISPRSPAPDLLLLDKLLLQAGCAGCSVLICINKADLYMSEAQALREEYQNSGAKIVITSTVDGTGIDELKAQLRHQITCFSGQSAVGKSSLLNTLFPQTGLQTGDLSRIGRGRHTTRHLEIFLHEDCMVADTPGFSLLEAATLEPEQLAEYYPEFEPYIGSCRFDGCLHASEPGCAVKEAVGSHIAQGRYERYLVLLEELRERWRKKYD